MFIKPISLLKKGIDDLKETWPDEPDRFTEDHVDPFFIWATDKGTSDVTLQSSRPIYNEISGTLYPATHRALDAADLNAFIAKLYGMEALALLAGGNDLDLSYEVMIDRYKRIRFRVNITAILADGRDGLQITMRSLPDTPPTMQDLDIEQEIIDHWSPRQGLILITGPTGSGKSTLLAAGNRMVIERGCGKMVTYESPIEFTYDNIKSKRSLVAQTEIPRHLPTFSAGVRNALRRKPEIILVGEARDAETISATIEAGQTGHVVYTTLHTTGVAETIKRMVSSFGPEERSERAYSLMESLRLIVTQTLVPRIGGGRVGLREWMPFSEEIREKLLSMDFNEWSFEVMQLIPRYGQRMEESARIQFELGTIERRSYLLYASGKGG